MKALTLTQPWATLVATGAKRFETRSWQPHHLGPVAIHAAREFPPEAQSRCYEDPTFYGALFGTSVIGDFEAGIDYRSRVTALPCGVVIAVARLEWAEPTTNVYLPDLLDRLGGPHEFAFGDYGPGRWAWYLAEVRALAEPIPARGALGLWEWTPPAGWQAPRAAGQDEAPIEVAAPDAGVVCPVRGCGRPIRSDVLMCRDDWYRVPVELRREVRARWRDRLRALEDGQDYEQAAGLHEAAKAAAVRAVEERAGR